MNNSKLSIVQFKVNENDDDVPALVNITSNRNRPKLTIDSAYDIPKFADQRLGLIQEVPEEAIHSKQNIIGSILGKQIPVRFLGDQTQSDQVIHRLVVELMDQVRGSQISEIEEISDSRIDQLLIQLRNQISEAQDQIIKRIDDVRNINTKQDIRIPLIENEILLLKEKVSLLSNHQSLLIDKATHRKNLNSNLQLTEQLYTIILKLEINLNVNLNRFNLERSMNANEREKALQLEIKGIRQALKMQEKQNKDTEDALRTQTESYKEFQSQLQDVRKQIITQLKQIREYQQGFLNQTDTQKLQTRHKSKSALRKRMTLAGNQIPTFQVLNQQEGEDQQTTQYQNNRNSTFVGISKSTRIPSPIKKSEIQVVQVKQNNQRSSVTQIKLLSADYFKKLGTN